ncbi:ABC transporter ATP-binding protein [Cohnella hongkongensis]|uniref:ABC transporter ATP-binding protein n=1 Tax=Cohnella hongkongensis TaxID=178337 RepID=A0ABV9FIZ9_9BACL
MEKELHVLEACGIRKSYPSGGQRVDVLKGIEMTLASGRLTMLRGRSGSGKTTLLNVLGGLDRPTEGEVRLRGRSLGRWSDKQLAVMRRKEIGFVFQSSALLPLLSVRENVELCLRMAGVPRSEWHGRTAYCLEAVGLSKRHDHRPNELSGGEQQRVAIAKAIAHKPNLLLADEPTAELDSAMAARMIGVFRDIAATEGTAICMTTHDSALWGAADVVYEMADGQLVIR